MIIMLRWCRFTAKIQDVQRLSFLLNDDRSEIELKQVLRLWTGTIINIVVYAYCSVAFDSVNYENLSATIKCRFNDHFSLWKATK